MRTAINKFDNDAMQKALKTIDTARQAEPKRQQQKVALETRLVNQQTEAGIVEANIKEKTIRLTEFQALRVKAERGERVVCLSCENEVTATHVQQKIQTIEDEKKHLEEALVVKKKDIATGWVEHGELLKKLVRIADCLKTENQILYQIQSHKDQQGQLKLAENSISEIQNRINGLNVKIAAETAELQRVATELERVRAEGQCALQPIIDAQKGIVERMATSTEEVQRLRRVLADIGGQIALYKKENDDKLLEIGRLDAQISELKNTQKTVKNLQDQVTTMRVRVNRLKILEKMFGPDGVQSAIVEKYVPLLNAYLRNYVHAVSDGRMQASIVTDGKREGKVELLVTGESASQSQLLSGGEAVKLRLALDISLGLLAFARSREVPEFICLDEIFAPVDAATKDLVFIMLQKLQEHFQTIIVISHDPILQNHIRDTIVVNKVGGISRIEKPEENSGE